MNKPRKVIIATRRSALALWQANTVKALLEKAGLDVELSLITTSGDKMQRGALADVALDDPRLPAHLKTGKGLFVKEVQEEILEHRADLAVHSMKDLPVEQTEGLRVSAVLLRANPADVMIMSPLLLESLKSVARLPTKLDSSPAELLESLRKLRWENASPIGTTSARRQFFLRKFFAPGSLPLVVLRGNVDTRLSRVMNNEFSYIMLARAGIDRLGLFKPDHMLTLPTYISTPAPAQGIVAIECREDDTQLRTILAQLNCSNTALQAACERATLWLTGGSCHTALAAHLNGDKLTTWAAQGESSSELIFEISEREMTELNQLKETDDYQGLFSWILRSPLARRLHSELQNKSFDQLMPLREPLSTAPENSKC